MFVLESIQNRIGYKNIKSKKSISNRNATYQRKTLKISKIYLLAEHCKFRVL